MISGVIVRRSVLVMTAVLWLGAGPAWGQARDPSFGAGGLVFTFRLGEAQLHAATDVAVQPDGRIVVTVEGSGSPAPGNWLVLRYLPDGRLDTGFGAGGMAVINTGHTAPAEALALQPDGKIVVTGLATCEQMENCFAAARLNPDGRLDPSFGTAGVARHSPVRRTAASDVTVQPDGRIVLAGDWYQGGDANDDELACLMRLLPDGRLDTSFSRDGLVRLDHGHGDDYLVGVEMQGRRILATGAGRFITGLRGGFAVVRLRPDGSRDRSFGRRGRRIVTFGRRRWALPTAVATAPRGRIVVAGIAGRTAERWDPAVARLTRNGRLDRGFGRGGRVVSPVRPFGGTADALQVDAGGGVLLAGHAFNGPRLDASNSALTLLRYSAAGRLERLLRDDLDTGTDRAFALALAGDRAVAAGTYGSILGITRYVLP
jgi:uncharacterized delta-60 repeat protein